MKARDLDSLLLEDRKYPEGIVAPVMRAARADRVEQPRHGFAEVPRKNRCVLVAAGRNGRNRSEINGSWHDKAIGIIGVLADQVHASGSHKDNGFLAKLFPVCLSDTAYIKHA